jgi:hypothetical protein
MAGEQTLPPEVLRYIDNVWPEEHQDTVKCSLYLSNGFWKWRSVPYGLHDSCHGDYETQGEGELPWKGDFKGFKDGCNHFMMNNEMQDRAVENKYAFRLSPEQSAAVAAPSGGGNDVSAEAADTMAAARTLAGISNKEAKTQEPKTPAKRKPAASRSPTSSKPASKRSTTTYSAPAPAAAAEQESEMVFLSKENMELFQKMSPDIEELVNEHSEQMERMLVDSGGRDTLAFGDIHVPLMRGWHEFVEDLSFNVTKIQIQSKRSDAAFKIAGGKEALANIYEKLSRDVVVSFQTLADIITDTAIHEDFSEAFKKLSGDMNTALLAVKAMLDALQPTVVYT